MNGGIGRDAALSASESAQRADLYLNVRWLGRMEFARALALQEELVAKNGRTRPSGRSAASSRTRTGLHDWAHA